MKCMCCDEDAQWVRYTQFAGDHYFCDLHGLMEEDFGQSDTYAYWAGYWAGFFQGKKVEKKLYMVETVSIFRMRYVVEAREASHAEEEVVMRLTADDFKEFSQKHVDECITSTRELSATDFVKEFDTDNDYLKAWPVSKKMEFINSIVYEDNE